MRSNLRFLCPNCHALTDTFAGKNRKLTPDKRFTEEKVLESYAALLVEGTTPTANALSNHMGIRIRNSYEKERIEAVCAEHSLELSRAPKPGSSKAPRTKIVWPSHDDLLKMLEDRPRTEVAKMLGVSDVAIKKHCLRHDIQEPKGYRVSAKVKTERNEKRKTKASAETRREMRLRKLRGLHGTMAGYRLEVRLKVPTCDPCRSANTQYSAQYKR